MRGRSTRFWVWTCTESERVVDRLYTETHKASRQRIHASDEDYGEDEKTTERDARFVAVRSEELSVAHAWTTDTTGNSTLVPRGSQFSASTSSGSPPCSHHPTLAALTSKPQHDRSSSRLRSLSLSLSVAIISFLRSYHPTRVSSLSTCPTSLVCPSPLPPILRPSPLPSTDKNVSEYANPRRTDKITLGTAAYSDTTDNL